MGQLCNVIPPLQEILTLNVQLSMSPNSNVSPWTYYGGTPSGLPSGANVIGTAVLVEGSGARGYACLRDDLTYVYGYSFSSDPVILRIAYTV